MYYLFPFQKSLTCPLLGRKEKKIRVNTVVMGSNSIDALKFLGAISNSLLHLRKRPHKNMPYIILLMHLVSHKRFIYSTNVFVIRYSVMMAVGSCQLTRSS